jgi:hypothetical protein
MRQHMEMRLAGRRRQGRQRGRIQQRAAGAVADDDLGPRAVIVALAPLALAAIARRPRGVAGSDTHRAIGRGRKHREHARRRPLELAVEHLRGLVPGLLPEPGAGRQPQGDDGHAHQPRQAPEQRGARQGHGAASGTGGYSA